MRELTSNETLKTTSFSFALGIITTYLCGIVIFHIQPSLALPQYCATKGLTCNACHITAQGAGLRTRLGWRESKNTSLLKPESVGLGRIYSHDGASNSLFDERLLLGFDFRAQSARSHKSKDSKRRFFPMQASLYSSMKFTDYLTVEGAYHFGPMKFLAQQKWTGSFILHPGSMPVQFRAGFFQPSIGIRHDDHTMMIRQVGGADGSTLIPVNYAEYGAELSFSHAGWYTVTTGVFDAGNLAENRVIDTYGTEISLLKDKNNPSVIGRIELRKRNIIENLHGNAGVSYLKNDDFSLTNVFASAGLFERLAVLTEYATSEKRDARTTKNVALVLSYRVINGLDVFARGERGKTELNFGDFDVKNHTNQVIFGAQLYIVPYIAVRPEYRIVDTERFRSTRYAIQIHVFR